MLIRGSAAQVGFEEPLTEESFADGEALMREGRQGQTSVLTEHLTIGR